jgi:hypothetical protein
MSVVVNACLQIEKNEPPITVMLITLSYTEDRNFEFEFRRYDHNKATLFGHRNFIDDNDVASWRRLGRAIANNPTICHWGIADYSDLDADECFESFYDELKENKLIKSLRSDTIEQIISMFDLGYILQNNTNMKDLELISDEDRLVTMEQGHMIGAALRGAQLRRLDICCCAFENNAAFGLIVSACLGVEDLSVICETNSHYTALAALIQNPMSMLKILSVDQNIGGESDEEAFDGRLVLRELAASLVGNTTMKELYLPLFTEEEVDEFDALLCNSSSIGNIYNSNHTLERSDKINSGHIFQHSFQSVYSSTKMRTKPR